MVEGHCLASKCFWCSIKANMAPRDIAHTNFATPGLFDRMKTTNLVDSHPICVSRQITS